MLKKWKWNDSLKVWRFRVEWPNRPSRAPMPSTRRAHISINSAAAQLLLETEWLNFKFSSSPLCILCTLAATTASLFRSSLSLSLVLMCVRAVCNFNSKSHAALWSKGQNITRFEYARANFSALSFPPANVGFWDQWRSWIFTLTFAKFTALTLLYGIMYHYNDCFILNKTVNTILLKSSVLEANKPNIFKWLCKNHLTLK